MLAHYAEVRRRKGRRSRANKIGAKCEHSAVGKLPERWLIFDDPSLLRLGNISRSASTPKAEIENL